MSRNIWNLACATTSANESIDEATERAGTRLVTQPMFKVHVGKHLEFLHGRWAYAKSILTGGREFPNHCFESYLNQINDMINVTEVVELGDPDNYDKQSIPPARRHLHLLDEETQTAFWEEQ